MRGRATGVGVAVIATMLVAGYVQAGASAAPGPPEQSVREQNLDGNGWIAVHEQGTANVNVLGGSLEVSNLPEVQAVSEVNMPGLHVFQQDSQATMEVGSVSGKSCMEIPSGMRVGIQHVSGRILATEDQGPYEIRFSTVLDDDVTTHYLEPTRIKTLLSGHDAFHFGGPLIAYADEVFAGLNALTELCLSVLRNGNETADEWHVSWSVSGYLIND